MVGAQPKRRRNHANQEIGHEYALFVKDNKGNNLPEPLRFYYLQEALDTMYDIGNSESMVGGKAQIYLNNGTLLASYTFE